MSPLEDAISTLLANPVPFISAFVIALIIPPFIAYIISKAPKEPFLTPKDFKPLLLGQKEFITHNTLRLRFKLASSKQRLGLPIGQHITFLGKDESNKDVYRPYTPVSDDDQLGSVDFVIKIYPQGKMSQILKKLQVGQSILAKGPRGRFNYTPNMKRHIGMIAGGTGITPMYQVLTAILKNPLDTTEVSLICGNMSVDDILLGKELDQLAAAHPNRLKVYHVLNHPPLKWAGGSGFVSAEMLRAHLPAPSLTTLVLRCGPPAMNDAMKKHLDGLGYGEEMQFQF